MNKSLRQLFTIVVALFVILGMSGGFLLTKSSAHGNIILAFGTRDAFTHGEMAEWSKAPVLKTGDVKASVGSNPTLSARK